MSRPLAEIADRRGGIGVGVGVGVGQASDVEGASARRTYDE
jgi:hypothetical protein